MAVSLSIEDEIVVKKRLLTQTTVARLNADPPLKKVAKRFVALCAAAQSGFEGDAGKKAHAQLLRELALFEFQLSRATTVCGANEREQDNYARQQAQLEQAMEEALRDIEALKVELEGARVERKQKEEYEVLRKKCMQHPSRADTLAAIASVKSEIAALESESNESAATVELRKQQFAELLRAVDDLGSALEGGTVAVAGQSAPMQTD